MGRMQKGAAISGERSPWASLLYGSGNPVKPHPSPTALGEHRAPQAGQVEQDVGYQLKPVHPPILYLTGSAELLPKNCKKHFGKLYNAAHKQQKLL